MRLIVAFIVGSVVGRRDTGEQPGSARAFGDGHAGQQLKTDQQISFRNL
jgi:hypothetical protein